MLNLKIESDLLLKADNQLLVSGRVTNTSSRTLGKVTPEKVTVNGLEMVIVKSKAIDNFKPGQTVDFDLELAMPDDAPFELVSMSNAKTIIVFDCESTVTRENYDQLPTWRGIES